MFHDRGNVFQFVTLEKDLAPAGRLAEEKSFQFEFKGVEKQYESFQGLNVRLRYFLRFTIFVRRSLSNIVKEKDFWVHNYQLEPETNNPIKMEVGIEDCLHIEVFFLFVFVFFVCF
jgi:vacuolar protein sorting-associated protein 26